MTAGAIRVGHANQGRLPPAVFVVAAAALVLNTIFSQPARAAIGLAIVFAGVPAYFIWRRGSESIREDK